VRALVIEAHIDLDENWRAQDTRKLANIAKVVRFFKNFIPHYFTVRNRSFSILGTSADAIPHSLQE
jgi:hypothetical protein